MGKWHGNVCWRKRCPGIEIDTKRCRINPKNNILSTIFENFNVLHTNFIFDFVLQCIKLFMLLQVCCMSSKESLECHFCLHIEKMIDYQQGSKGSLWIIDLLNLKLVNNSIVVCIVKELFFLFCHVQISKITWLYVLHIAGKPSMSRGAWKRFCYV